MVTPYEISNLEVPNWLEKKIFYKQDLRNYLMNSKSNDCSFPALTALDHKKHMNLSAPWLHQWIG